MNVKPLGDLIFDLECKIDADSVEAVQVIIDALDEIHTLMIDIGDILDKNGIK